jgi:chorismate mutase-like protein
VDDLERLRGEINAVDKGLIELLARRNEISSEIGEYKREKGLKIQDTKREREMMNQRTAWAKEHGVRDELIQRFFRLIVKASKEIQQK